MTIDLDIFGIDVIIISIVADTDPTIGNTAAQLIHGIKRRTIFITGQIVTIGSYFVATILSFGSSGCGHFHIVCTAVGTGEIEFSGTDGCRIFGKGHRLDGTVFIYTGKLFVDHQLDRFRFSAIVFNGKVVSSAIFTNFQPVEVSSITEANPAGFRFTQQSKLFASYIIFGRCLFKQRLDRFDRYIISGTDVVGIIGSDLEVILFTGIQQSVTDRFTIEIAIFGSDRGNCFFAESAVCICRSFDQNKRNRFCHIAQGDIVFTGTGNFQFLVVHTIAVADPVSYSFAVDFQKESITSSVIRGLVSVNADCSFIPHEIVSNY